LVDSPSFASNIVVVQRVMLFIQ